MNVISVNTTLAAPRIGTLYLQYPPELQTVQTRVIPYQGGLDHEKTVAPN